MRNCALEAIWLICWRASRADREGSSFSRGEQEFHIAFGAGDRARHDALHRPAARCHPLRRIGADPLVDGGIADDAAFADLAPLRLELRLYESHQAAAGRGEI